MSRSRLPTGLAYSVIVLALTFSVLLGLWLLAPADARRFELLVHGFAALCLFWSLARFVVERSFPAFVKQPAGQDLLAVLRLAMLLVGWTALFCMGFAAVTEIVFRIVAFDRQFVWRMEIWDTGWVDLVLLTLAVLIRWRSSGNNQLVTNAFWILIFAGLWASLQIQPLRSVPGAGGLSLGVTSPWPSVLIFSWGLSILAFTVFGGWVIRYRRARAWPDRLWLLVEPPEDWPGFRYSAGLVTVLMLVLGTAFVTQPWTSVGAFLAGCSLLGLVHRRWDENLADAALAAITLSIVALCMFGLPQPEFYNPAEKYAEIFNRAIIGLAVMTWFWHWLGAFWMQQLDEGRPWTTAGRLIRTSRRVGFLIAAAAVLIAASLAFWPRRSFVSAPDNDLYRWIMGAIAYTLLFGALLTAARRTGKPTLSWLALFTAAAAVVFVFARAPHHPVITWLTRYWQAVVVMLAMAFLLLACVARRWERLHCHFEPAFLTSVMILPMLSAAGVLLVDSTSMEPWMPIVTFILLTIHYVLAAILIGPGAFIGVAVVCAAGALLNLGIAGLHNGPIAPYLYVLLVSCSAALFAVLNKTKQ